MAGGAIILKLDCPSSAAVEDFTAQPSEVFQGDSFPTAPKKLFEHDPHHPMHLKARRRSSSSGRWSKNDDVTLMIEHSRGVHNSPPIYTEVEMKKLK